MGISGFFDKVRSNEFVVTAEIFPPKGVNIDKVSHKIDILKGCVDAINVTDCQRAVMRVSPLALSKVIIDAGVEPIYQITCRDRNRLALQSDVLGAYVLGVRNILVISGDYPSIGDHPNAKPVYDLDTIQLIKSIKDLEAGFDIAGKALNGAPRFVVGAAFNPGTTPVELGIMSMQKKIDAGAEFFQSQPVFSISEFREFKKNMPRVNVLVGVLLLKSYEFALRISKIPGINIPETIINRLKASKDELKEGIKISQEFIAELREQADGVHIMAIGVEENIPQMLLRNI